MSGITMSTLVNHPYIPIIQRYLCQHSLCPTMNKTKTASGGYCSTCYEVYYCSPACQKQDWRLHKPGCVSIDVAGPTVDADFFPDPLLSEAAEVIPEEGARRRKRLFRALAHFKKQVEANKVEFWVIEDDELRAVAHQRMRLSLHQVAASWLFLGQGRKGKKYMRLAFRDWRRSKSLSANPMFSLFQPGWSLLQSFSHFVERDNNVQLLRKMYIRCDEADVRSKKNLGLGILIEMDEKIAAGEQILRPHALITLIHRVWICSKEWESKHGVLRQAEYVTRIKLVIRADVQADAMTRAETGHATLMARYMEDTDLVQLLGHTPYEVCDGKVKRWCHNTSCPQDRWGSANVCTLVCGKCEHGYYCSKGCQTSHWPEHKVMCANLALVGKTVRTSLNADVSAARHTSKQLAELLVELNTKIPPAQQAMQEMQQERVLEMCPKEEIKRTLSKMRATGSALIEWIISATQVLLLQGRTTKAHAVLEEGCKMRNVGALETGSSDEGDLIAVVMASARLDRRLKELSVEVDYYVHEQVLVRLLHERALTIPGFKSVLLYSAIFEEIEIQIQFCRKNGMIARQFYALYFLWREGRRYRKEYRGQESIDEHDNGEKDVKRIQAVLADLDPPHLIAVQLHAEYAGDDEKLARMTEDERVVAFDMQFKLSCMQGSTRMMRGEVARMKV